MITSQVQVIPPPPFWPTTKFFYGSVNSTHQVAPDLFKSNFEPLTATWATRFKIQIHFWFCEMQPQREQARSRPKIGIQSNLYITLDALVLIVHWPESQTKTNILVKRRPRHPETEWNVFHWSSSHCSSNSHNCKLHSPSLYSSPSHHLFQHSLVSKSYRKSDFKRECRHPR